MRVLSWLISFLERALSSPESSSAKDDQDRAECAALFLDYAKARYKDEDQRFEFAELKASRYITVIGLFAAANAYRLADLRQILRHANSLAGGLFTAAYVVTFACAAFSLGRAFGVMRVKGVPGAPLEGVAEVFRRRDATGIQVSQAHRFIKGALDLRKAADEKFTLLESARKGIVGLFVASFALVLAYMFLPASTLDEQRPTATVEKPAPLSSRNSFCEFPFYVITSASPQDFK